MRWCGEEISTEYQKDLLTPAATTRKIELKREKDGQIELRKERKKERQIKRKKVRKTDKKKESKWVGIDKKLKCGLKSLQKLGDTFRGRQKRMKKVLKANKSERERKVNGWCDQMDRSFCRFGHQQQWILTQQYKNVPKQVQKSQNFAKPDHTGQRANEREPKKKKNCHSMQVDFALFIWSSDELFILLRT